MANSQEWFPFVPGSVAGIAPTTPAVAVGPALLLWHMINSPFALVVIVPVDGDVGRLVVTLPACVDLLSSAERNPGLNTNTCMERNGPALLAVQVNVEDPPEKPKVNEGWMVPREA